MQVTILTELSDAQRSYQAGEVVDMPDEQAQRWIAAGWATEGGHATGPPEQAARHTGQKR